MHRKAIDVRVFDMVCLPDVAAQVADYGAMSQRVNAIVSHFDQKLRIKIEDELRDKPQDLMEFQDQIECEIYDLLIEDALRFSSSVLQQLQGA